ncbi:MAG: ribonuclease [Lachnospiraceae bacterium]|nr:ribonuclease [Lachnospiraceae bacterium]
MLVLATACGAASKPAGGSAAQGGTPAAESVVSGESRTEKEPAKTDSKAAESAAPKEDAASKESTGTSKESTASGTASKDSTGNTGKSEAGAAESASSGKAEEESSLDRDGTYTSKEDVALYLHLYGELPSNFITKKEARALGWEGGSLEPYAPGKCIGGDRFGNYEGLLPDVKGRKYYECDIDTLGKKKRGAKRIIYSSDGQIYYTGDHYESFELLYGEE